MTLELKKQKLREYIETASEEEIEFLYQETVEDTGSIEWNEEFTSEMEERASEMENSNVQPIRLEQSLQNAKNAIQKVRDRAAIPN